MQNIRGIGTQSTSIVVVEAVKSRSGKGIDNNEKPLRKSSFYIIYLYIFIIK